MSNNPYSSPNEAQVTSRSARDMLAGPAVALIALSLCCIVVLLATLAMNAYLMLSGAAGRLPRPGIGITKEEQIGLRAAWEIVMLVANVVILFGAVKMKRLENYRLAKTSAVIAMIPCVGPCCLAGIPFGFWAMVVLNNPEVADAFDERESE